MPDLHSRLRTEVEKRIEVAKAAAAVLTTGGMSPPGLRPWVDFAAIHTPEDALARYGAALRTIERHMPVGHPAKPECCNWCDLDPRWPCADLRDLAASLGVDLDG